MVVTRSVLAGLAILAACAPQPPEAIAPLAAAAPVGLSQPRVATPDPTRPRYVRDEWQPHGWADADRDGCNTRAEVLMVEAKGPTTHKPTNCTVVSGTWVDPYTGRAVTLAAQLQVDHLVALGDAAASGGWAWSLERKRRFADNLEDEWALNAVWGPENERKADRGPDRWLPPNPAFRCTYVRAYAAIKARWGLTVTPSQWAAVTKVWSTCPRETP